MKAPDFSLKEARTGKTVRLSDFAGKPVLLTFWVSWCPDCQRDLPQKEAFYRTMNKDALGFLTINATGREAAPDDGIRFIEDQKLTFPVLLDDGLKTYEAYGCTCVPSTFIIDADGNIVQRFGDKAAFYEIVEALGPLLSEQEQAESGRE
jgi:peroxiredoxin